MPPLVIRRPKVAQDILLGVSLARMHDRPIGPSDVARILRNAGVKYVIIGAHAANGYTGRPRTTVDVDVLAQFPKKAAKAIATAFPSLKMQDTPVVIRFKDDEHEAIDIMKPSTSKLWPYLLKTALEIRIGREPVRIPTLEGILAAKLAAMVSPGRRLPDKQQDGVDFLRIVEANSDVNLPQLEHVGELVYPGGGKEILRLVGDARAGKRLDF